MSATSLHAIAKALRGTVTGRSVLAPGPGHSVYDRSLSVMLADMAPDGFLIYSHAGDDWRACRDHVRAQLGLSPFRHGREPRQAPQRERTVEAPSPNNHKTALHLWRQALEPRAEHLSRRI
jgi:putative DNA primase/helicase